MNKKLNLFIFVKVYVYSRAKKKSTDRNEKNYLT